MQTLISKVGFKNFLKVDITYLTNFLDGTEYKLVLKKENCDEESLNSIGKSCGGYAMFEIEFKRCLPKSGKWLLFIKDFNTSELIHQLYISVSIQ